MRAGRIGFHHSFGIVQYFIIRAHPTGVQYFLLVEECFKGEHVML